MKRLCIAGALVLAVLLSACGPAATPAPTATPQPVPVTRLEDIVGTWEGIGFDGLFQRFHPDGTCQVGITLEGLDRPDALLTVRLEATKFIFTEVEATALDPCPTNYKTGTYEIQRLANGNIQFVVVEDSCAKRRRSMSLEHRPVLPVR